MGKQQRKFSTEFKARVALEALKGRKTVSQLASEFQVHPTQISVWKKQGMINLKDSFRSGRKGAVVTSKQQMDTLYRQIGKLQVENEFLKQAVYPDAA
tara:strand:- start:172 stop:465 length:294 start_codon:yes stop_codon:yes gene_type:complete